MEAWVINLKRRTDRMVSFNQNQFPFPVVRMEAFENSIGEDGCTSSHLYAMWNHFTLPFAVFEDDFVLVQPWSVVEKAMKQLPPDWDALWLGANPRRRLDQYSENLYRIKRAFGLHGVIYNTQRIIDYIHYNHNTPSGTNLDIFIARDVMQKFNCYSVWPMVGTQLSDVSDIAKIKTNNCAELIENYKRCTR